jgi:ABC-type Fe3+/spermidine/putrescine transport system ATPase subunit
MPRIELKSISKHILNDLSLTVEDKEIVALVGPNGAGKSTVLNVIAGLIDYKGEVSFDGNKMDRVPPHRRGIGYLFQDLALFPHLTVAANIAYGLRVQGYEDRVIAERVDKLARDLRIERLKERYPQSLSGGEKQRVAIARAIAPFQRVLLLDEPTASLDAQTAKYLRVELGTLLRRLEITAVLVIHDLLGAEEIADRIAIIHKGRIEQVASPETIFFHPRTEVVSEFIGRPNILTCDQCHVLSSGLVEITSGDMRMVLPYEGDMIGKIAISPHDIYVSATKPPGPTINRYQGIVTEIVHHRSMVRLGISIGRTSLVAELPEDVFDEMDIAEGREVYVVVKLRRLRYVESA